MDKFPANGYALVSGQDVTVRWWYPGSYLKRTGSRVTQ